MAKKTTEKDVLIVRDEKTGEISVVAGLNADGSPKRTLQRYRSIGALPYKTLGKKTYYSEEDVLTFLSGHVKDFKKEDIAFYKARIHNFFQK